jgi:hypothetical protein
MISPGTRSFAWWTTRVIAAGALAFGMTGASATAEAHTVGRAQVVAEPTINTYALWNGKSSTGGFACRGTTTMGQVITVPDGITSLDQFASWIRPYGSGSVVIRGEVYAWDGAKAAGTGLYESPPVTLSDTDFTFHKLAFVTGGVPVTAGRKYVLFISADKDFDQCLPGYSIDSASVKGDVYAGGHSMYVRSFGHWSWWTTQKWHHPTNDNDDDAVKVFLS